MPKKIFSKLAVVSAMPSMRPMIAVRTPSTLARKNGTRLISISEEMSFNSDVIVRTHTLRGRRRSLFCFCMFIHKRSLPVPFIAGNARLFHPDHLSVHIDDYLEARHPKISPHIFGNAHLHQLVELLIDILELLFDHCL